MKTVRHIFFEHVRYTVKGQIFQEVGCMTEFVIIGTFAVLLIIGTVLSVPLIYTLLMGFALFLATVFPVVFPPKPSCAQPQIHLGSPFPLLLFLPLSVP